MKKIEIQLADENYAILEQGAKRLGCTAEQLLQRMASNLCPYIDLKMKEADKAVTEGNANG